MNNDFLKDMLKGLGKTPKSLNSKYFYDKKGDLIFQEIMNMPTYYLPGLELEIIKNKSIEIANSIEDEAIDIVELGAGDGIKTVSLLQEFEKAGKKITYIPLDISADVLNTNKKNVLKEIPSLEIESIAGDYSQTMASLKKRKRTKLILFLGSNIGNFKGFEGVAFLKLVREQMQNGDFLLLGADLKKNPKTVLAAYNDPEGITASFNLNLLSRMNRELGANFNIDNFEHYSTYDPISGTCYSYLVSLSEQYVEIGNSSFTFEKDECIHTEVSQKYSLEDLNNITQEAGFKTFYPYLDSKAWFSLSLVKY